MGAPHGWRARLRRCSIGLIMSDPHSAVLSWVGGERIAISGMPARHAVSRLADQGVTHVVNCRARSQVKMSGDLAAEREAFPGRVVHAPMWDLGQRQRPRLWAEAAAFAASALADDPQARVLIHCHWGRRRSAMLAYAVLRLRGHDVKSATELVLTYRPQAELVRNYVRSVENWLSARVSHAAHAGLAPVVPVPLPADPAGAVPARELAACEAVPATTVTSPAA
jgi:protein-tyrosine phosphatase